MLSNIPIFKKIPDPIVFPSFSSFLRVVKMNIHQVLTKYGINNIKNTENISLCQMVPIATVVKWEKNTKKLPYIKGFRDFDNKNYILTYQNEV